MNIQHKEHKQNHNCGGVSIAYCKHTRKSLLWVDDASHSLGRTSSWSLAIWAIMTGVIARPGDHTLAKCMKAAIYLELEATPVDGRRLLTAQIVAFVHEGVRLCGILGGEDPSFLPLLTSFLNVRSQLRQATADGVVLDANCWRESCGPIWHFIAASAPYNGCPGIYQWSKCMAVCEASHLVLWKIWRDCRPLLECQRIGSENGWDTAAQATEGRAEPIDLCCLLFKQLVRRWVSTTIGAEHHETKRRTYSADASSDWRACLWRSEYHCDCTNVIHKKKL